MIRFSAFLVVVAVGLLVAGVVTSTLMLVYVAIGVSGVAMLTLGVGVAVHWRELTGKPQTAAAEAGAPARRAAVPATAGAATGAAVTGSGWPAAPSAARPSWSPAAPSRTGYLPTEQPTKASAPPWPGGASLTPDTPPPVGKDSGSPQPPAAEHQTEPVSAASASASPRPGRAQQADQAKRAEEPEQASEPARPSEPEQARQPEQANDPGHAGPPEPVGSGPDPDLQVTVVPGVPRYHNARCILIRFMGEDALDKMTVAAAREIGCTPCRACLPDQPDKSPE